MTNEPTHLDLFSGIGGFALAAQWAGFRTVAFVEKEERCQNFLRSAWPGVTLHPDITAFDGRPYRGTTLLTGGPPCQPASRAGEQRGEGDDRWLWPHALRVLKEVEPDAVVFENPPGILDVGIDGILSQMERCGYEVQPFDIPACALDSPQLRHRIWIVGFRNVGHATQRGLGANGSTPGSSGHAHHSSLGNTKRARKNAPAQASRSRSTDSEPDCNLADAARNGEQRARGIATEQNRDRSDGRLHHGSAALDVANAGSQGFSESEHETVQRTRRGEERRTTAKFSQAQSAMADTTSSRRTTESKLDGKPAQDTADWDSPWRHAHGCGFEAWSDYVWVPCADGKVRRAPDDAFGLVDGLHRSVLGALGNSIVPAVAYEILKNIRTLI